MCSGWQMDKSDNLAQMHGRSMLFVGAIPETGWHCHSADAWVFGLDRNIQVVLSDRVMETRSAAIPAGTSHRIVANDTRFCVVYADPLMGARQSQVHRLTSQTEEAHWLGNLIKITESRDPLEAAAIFMQERQGSLTQLDPRIGQVLDAMQTRIDENIPTGELASSAGISESHLRSLVAGGIGLPLRRFRLWLRLLRAIEQLSVQRKITPAAMDAGFANPSHFSTAFRQHFGLAPRTVL